MEVAAARPLDFLEALDVRGNPLIRTRRLFGLHARQVAGSEALTFRDGAGALVAIVGAYDYGDGRWEGWLAAGPALKAQIAPLMRDLRRDMAVVAAVMPGQQLTVYIDPRSVAGGRLAAILGFHPCGPTDTPVGPLETWRRQF